MILTTVLYRLVNVLNIPKERPKLQDTLPPEKPPEVKPKGPFCIRAKCIIDNDAIFTGYNTDYTIAQETFDVCKSFSRSSKNQCSDPEVTIIPIDNIKNCERHIIYHNLITDRDSLMFP
tara:strand:+ start:68 stop:424 length:357 start_codon:yes stop_codon:yes gene_type:complete